LMLSHGTSGSRGRCSSSAASRRCLRPRGGCRLQPHEPMKPRRATALVTLLGTGNPRPSMTRFGPSILVEAGTKRILVDAGRGATQRLFSLGDGMFSGIDLVLLTHLHSDHVVGLPDLWLTGWIFGREKPLPVRGAQGTAAMMSHLKAAYAFDIGIRRDVDERFPAAGIEVDAVDLQSG